MCQNQTSSPTIRPSKTLLSKNFNKSETMSFNNSCLNGRLLNKKFNKLALFLKNKSQTIGNSLKLFKMKQKIPIDLKLNS